MTDIIFEYKELLASKLEIEQKLKEICDITFVAPANETYLVQEYHLPVYHAICAEVERVLFGE